MKKFLCLLPICIYPSNKSSNNGEKRINQYINGFKKFFEYLELLKQYNVDVYVFDNSIDKNKTLPKEFIDIIPESVTILHDNVNNYGRINKGAGLIETWLHLQHIIEKYDYLIHFEPRQLLLNFNFIEHFLKNNTNLFTYGKGNNHFNTGLFCIQSSVLIDFINYVNIDIMVEKYISIEYDIYNYFTIQNIHFNIIDKMGLIWHDVVTDKEICM